MLEPDARRANDSHTEESIENSIHKAPQHPRSTAPPHTHQHPSDTPWMLQFTGGNRSAIIHSRADHKAHDHLPTHLRRRRALDALRKTPAN